MSDYEAACEIRAVIQEQVCPLLERIATALERLAPAPADPATAVDLGAAPQATNDDSGVDLRW